MNARNLMTAAFVIICLLCAVTESPGADRPARNAQEGSSRLTILSIIPSKAEPGTSVTLYGSGYTEGTIAYLGNKEAQTSVVGPRELSFVIPDVDPGLYALFLRREDRAISKVYNFSVIARTPTLDSVTPDRIFACSTGNQREVQMNGSNIRERSQVLFDGAVIRSRIVSSESITVTIPQAPGGLHTLQVKNPGDVMSSPMALFIDSKPVITAVRQGEQYVNYYNLIIEGHNFMSNSMVVVEGKSMTSSSVNIYQREKVRFVDCTRLIYERHPYDSDVKNFGVQVTNPNGEESNVVQVSAP